MIEKEFQVHMLNAEGKVRANMLAEKFSDLLAFCKTVGMPGRELSLVATKLEEASFFAKKAMAINPNCQENQNG